MITTAAISSEILGQKDFEEIGRDVFMDRSSGDVVVLGAVGDEAVLIQRSNT